MQPVQGFVYGSRKQRHCSITYQHMVELGTWLIWGRQASRQKVSSGGQHVGLEPTRAQAWCGGPARMCSTQPPLHGLRGRARRASWRAQRQVPRLTCCTRRGTTPTKSALGPCRATMSRPTRKKVAASPHGPRPAAAAAASAPDVCGVRSAPGRGRVFQRQGPHSHRRRACRHAGGQELSQVQQEGHKGMPSLPQPRATCRYVLMTCGGSQRRVTRVAACRKATAHAQGPSSSLALHALLTRFARRGGVAEPRAQATDPVCVCCSRRTAWTSPPQPRQPQHQRLHPAPVARESGWGAGGGVGSRSPARCPGGWRLEATPAAGGWGTTWCPWCTPGAVAAAAAAPAHVAGYGL